MKAAFIFSLTDNVTKTYIKTLQQTNKTPPNNSEERKMSSIREPNLIVV